MSIEFHPSETLEDLQRWNSTHYAERKAELRERKRERVDTLAGVAHVPKVMTKTPLPSKTVEVSARFGSLGKLG